jgi:hypothetical protein
MYRWNGSSYTQLTDQTAIWGQVSGTLSNQTDLQNALDGKADNLDVFSGNYNDLSNKPNLSTVATSGNYNDLLNLPNLFSGAYVDLTGKPNLFSGNYNDLSNKPSLFSGNYGDLNNRPILSTVATSGNYGDLSNKPNLSIYVDKSSNETIGGEKTFTSNSIFSGGVGIGINPPLAKLDVNGASVFRTTDNYNVGLNVLRVNGLGMLGNRSSMYLTNRNPTGNIKFGVGGRHGAASEKMILTSTGDLGIGTNSPSAKLDVNGDIKATGDVEAFTSSDKRLKDNIVNIDKPIDKISKIGGYTYEWNDKSDKETGKKDIGVIAQEIEEFLPELVQTRENGYKAVKYDKIVALLIEGMKEQDKKITDLQSQINEIYKRI